MPADRCPGRGAARCALLPPPRVVRPRDPLRPPRHRAVRSDRRGRGLGRSTPPREDAVAVLDAVGSERAAVVAWRRVVSDRDRARGGRRRPDRRARARQPLRAASPRPRATRTALRPSSSRASSDDNPDPNTQWILEGADDLDLFAPSMARDDAAFRDWWIQHASRRAASPANARAYLALTVARRRA